MSEAEQKEKPGEDNAEKLESGDEEKLTFKSSRFGDLEVPAWSVIEFPAGLIGFPRHKSFVMLDHKPPFSWLHSTEDANLAFVVVDGFEFGENYKVRPPLGDPHCDLKDEDEFAILVIVTVRPDPRDTTANLKAPLFVNLRNRKGIQVIFEDSDYSTRFSLWQEEAEGEGAAEGEAPAAESVEDSGEESK